MYEHKSHPVLPRPHFLRRVLAHFLIAWGVLLCSLLFGMLGYAHFEQLSWTDAFLNAAMLLGGMGPVDAPHTPDGKVFAGLYALYSGLIFLVAVSIMLAPVIHRVMHTFHWEAE
jgi:hypothetical protein